jgi:hypothetical protein
MNGYVFKKPSGNSAGANFQKAVYDNIVNESKLVFADGQEMGNTIQGRTVIAGGGGRAKKGSEVLTFKIRFVEEDYLVCRECDPDGLNLGSTDVYVAKPELLKCSYEDRVSWGTGPAFTSNTFTYAPDDSEPYMEFGVDVGGGLNFWGESESDYDPGGVLYQLKMNVIRTVEADGIEEDQRVIPVWVNGEIIHAIEFDGGQTAVGYITDAGQSIDYLMLNDGRTWARI